LTVSGLILITPWITSAQEDGGLQGHKVKAESFQADKIKEVMKSVADWQLIATPGKDALIKRHAPYHWTMGALFVGMHAWSQITEEPKYVNYLKTQCDTNQWKLGPQHFFADDHLVGELYLNFYAKEKNPEMIVALKKQFDAILEKPPETELKWKSKNHLDRWSWCDALFMSPPVWAKLSAATGDHKYADYMDREWWATTEYLYDKEEHLYFRDSTFFTRREANGKKMFWSRGNGWVFAGIPRVLAALPKDYPTRSKYETLFKEMAAKLISLQQADGFWRSGLLDPLSHRVKETSGTAFFCYGLAWGINQGYLDRGITLPHVIKAWEGLVGCVDPDGKLGYVQQIGVGPDRVTSDMTEVYGVGAFLLAGTEILKIANLPR